MRWGKQRSENSSLYPGGFEHTVILSGRSYRKPRNGQNVSIDPNERKAIPAIVLFRRGNLESNVQSNLRIRPFSTQVVGDNPLEVKIRINPFKASFTGFFKHPISGEKTKFEGAFQSSILLNPGEGRGSFPGVDESGSVRISVKIN